MDFDPDAYLASKTKKSPFDSALEAEGATGQVADIARSIYQQESGSGRNTKTSNAGAVGGMQIIPATFNRMADKGWAIDNPQQNAQAGIRYIKTLYDKSGGDPALTAAGYYGGEGGMEKARRGIAVSDPRNPNAPTTLQYGQQVASRMPAPSARLAEPAFDPDAYLASKAQVPAAQPAAKPAEQGMMQNIKQGAGNLVAGAVRGAGSIGATILAPYDMAKDALDGKGLSLQSNNERRQQMDAGLQSMGAEPDSWMYKGGKLAGEVAGTAGMGGVMANGASKIPMLAQSPALINALRTSGMSAGGATGAGAMAARVAGGAATGAATAGLVNPEDAGMGAIIGGAIPPAMDVAGKVIPMIGRGVANMVGGLGTQTGGETIKAATRAGYEGGAKSASFANNMRGNVPMEDVLQQAKGALSNIRAERGAQYRSGMLDISADKTVLDFAPIAKAVIKEKSIGTFGDKITNASTAETQQKIGDMIADWGKSNPVQYHTPEGLDALKQAIGDIRDSTQFGTPSRLVADRIYNAIKKQITDQAPTYSKVMSEYASASGNIKEVERALSLGNKAAADTGLRKLQSLTRNNVSTNYGNRLDMAKQLEEAGATNMLSDLAGQSLNSWMPRGLGKAVGGGVAAGGIMTGNALAIPVIAAQSPRLMGEAAYATGKMAKGINKLAELNLQRAAPVMFTQRDRRDQTK